MVRFFCALVLSSITLQGAIKSDLASRISKLHQLDAAAKSELAADLSNQALQKLSSEDRRAVDRAALAFSEKALGLRDDGQLKKVKGAVAKRVLELAGSYLEKLAPEKIPAHARAADLFGTIPSSAARIDRTVEIDPNVPFWHSTGLYAAPGEVVSIRVPKAWTNQGLKIHLSGHRDRISTEKDLVRLPQSPQRSFQITATETRVASAFGGAIYLDLGKGGKSGEPFEMQVSKALQAPYFVLGKTSLEAWTKLRQAPGPYAEMVTPRVAFSFPSAWIRELEDPRPLLEFWDNVTSLHDELAGFTEIRRAPERVNVDVQISVGLFHAGYPMQGPQNKCRGITDLEQLKKTGNWGWFHELGHESQRRPDKAWGWNNPYTFDGSVECTVNFFSAHALNRLGIKFDHGWGWTTHPEKVAQRARKVTDTEQTYAQADVGTKLAMVLQVRDAFGWNPIAATLKSYSDDQTKAPHKLPKGNQEKRDQFCLRLSRHLGHNLFPFMSQLWGIEVSPQIAEELKALPVWLPEGFEIKG